MEQEKETQRKLDEILAHLKGEKQVMNLDQLCAYTGLSKSFIYKKTSENLIPYFRPTGKILFFEKSLIDDWILRNRVKTQDEIKAESEKK